MQDIESYEQTQETMAFLKILALGTRQIEEDKVQPTGDVIQRLREPEQDSLMSLQIFLTDDASRDLEDLHTCIGLHNVSGKADFVLDHLAKAFSSLSENPERGTYPEELLAVGLCEYREIFVNPYRIIYRVMAKKVYLMVIADGRRDMQSLLQRRLLQA